MESGEEQRFGLSKRQAQGVSSGISMRSLGRSKRTNWLVCRIRREVDGNLIGVERGRGRRRAGVRDGGEAAGRTATVVEDDKLGNQFREFTVATFFGRVASIKIQVVMSAIVPYQDSISVDLTKISQKLQPDSFSPNTSPCSLTVPQQSCR